MGDVTGCERAGALVEFRNRLHSCFARWGDALFELTDAALCAPAPVGSVPSLSLEPVFRRSHGSLYKALARGRIDTERLRRLLVAARPEGWPLVLAPRRVDLGPLRRRDQPRAGLLLLGVEALGRPADRGGLVLSMGVGARLGPRLVDGTARRRAHRADGRPDDGNHRPGEAPRRAPSRRP